MSRTTTLFTVLAALLALAAPASAAPRWAIGDQVPHELPGPGAHVASATRWIVGARPGTASARLARAAGAAPQPLRGVYTVPAGRARALGLALRRRGLLRFSEPDRALRAQSAFEGDGRETAWARGFIVPNGAVPPAQPASIGIVDDLVDASVPDTSQAKIVKGSATRQVLGEHGTEVASVAAGQQNGTGVLGITPGAPILTWGLKDATSPCSEVSRGILDVAAAGARILNLSLGTTDDCFLLQLSVADAFASNTLVVASSGNEFAAGNPMVYPAAYPHVLSVGAVDVDLDPTYFSTSNAAVDLAAPGQDVPVALPPRFDNDGAQDGLATANGTSFAAPIVSGVASWLLGVRPHLTPGQAADVLRQSAKDLQTPGWDSSTGFGLVNLDGALKQPAPPVDPLEPNDGITFVDGTAYSKPDPYIWKGGAARKLTASVDAVEDPIDVYRIRVGAGRRATVRLKPTAGKAELRIYSGAAKGIQAHPLSRAAGTAGHTEVLHLRNRDGRARTFYVAIIAPSLTSRSFDAPYRLQLSRG